jgi:hypothetical protein
MEEPAEVQAAPAPVEPIVIKLPEPDLSSAGLQMVETQGAAPSPETASEEAPRRRRNRSASAQASAPAEPLVMVETKSSGDQPAA